MRASLLRTLVLDTYARVREQGHLADRALNRALREHKELHSSERRHVAEAVYAMLRLERRLDHLVARGAAAARLPSPASLPTPERNRLRYAAALVAEPGETPTSAAGIAGLDRAWAAALQPLTVAVPEEAWPADPLERLSVEHSLPQWVARRLLSQYGKDAPALAEALNRRAPLALRANTLRASREALAARLREEGVVSRPGALSPWALVLEGRPNVFALASFKEGLFEVQDEGSQLIALAAAPRPGMKVVDACAGAGGKTLALAATMENRGRIVACDVHEERLADLRPRARRAGAFNVEWRVVPDGNEGESALAGLWNAADVVLVDAPCSGTGSWRRNPDARWRMREDEADAFPALQRRILERSARLVKRGGRLVYATCSVLAAENEAVADAFAAAHPEFEPVPLAELPAAALDAAGRMRLLPHVHGTDGFFAAAWRRAQTAK